MLCLSISKFQRSVGGNIITRVELYNIVFVFQSSANTGIGNLVALVAALFSLVNLQCSCTR